MLESLFNKATFLRVCDFIKRDPIQMLSCKIYEIFKDNFEEHLSTTASNFYLKRDFNTGVFL